MRGRSILTLALCAVAVAALAAAWADKSPAGWTQWGGPGQEFRSSSTGLSSSWPEAGPRKLWERNLGEGYSAILADGGRLYTMYREGGDEVVACLEADSGKTVWEHRYAATPKEGHIAQFGTGPRATPLLAGDRLYTIGVAGRMLALDRASGKPQWSHELWDEFGGSVLQHGYSSSPIEYKDTILVLVGGAGHAIMAFDRKDGSVRWKALDFTNSYSTPRLLDVDGEQQLVTFMAGELIGVDPQNGALKWSIAHANQWGQNVCMPVMADRNHLFLSSPEAGARGLKLTKDGDKTKVEELWTTRKIQFYHVTSVRDGDWVYGSTGTAAPAFLAAVNIRTGEIGWRERGFAKANVVAADGKLYVLDEEGKLYLTTATPQALTVHAQTQMLERVAWTVPTIVGRTMFVRDQKKILALDLG